MQVTDEAWIQSCCGFGIGQQLQLCIHPLAWELPYAMGVALKKGGGPCASWMRGQVTLLEESAACGVNGPVKA